MWMLLFAGPASAYDLCETGPGSAAALADILNNRGETDCAIHAFPPGVPVLRTQPACLTA